MTLCCVMHMHRLFERIGDCGGAVGVGWTRRMGRAKLAVLPPMSIKSVQMMDEILHDVFMVHDGFLDADEFLHEQ